MDSHTWANQCGIIIDLIKKARTAMSKRSYPHYYKRVPDGVTHVDVYAVLRLWDVADPAVQHAVKKLLCTGQRGAKDRGTDLREARDAIARAIEMDEMFGHGGEL